MNLTFMDGPCQGMTRTIAGTEFFYTWINSIGERHVYQVEADGKCYFIRTDNKVNM